MTNIFRFRVLIIVCILPLFLTAYSSFANVENKKNIYHFSLDKTLTQNTGADLFLNGAEFLQYGLDSLQIETSFVKALVGIYPGFFVALLNHEISGHVIRAFENDIPVHKVFLNSPFYAAVSDGKGKNIIQDMVSYLGGNEANYVLAQKIKKRYFDNKMIITNIMGATYWFSSGNQFYYTVLYTPPRGGHDITNYTDLVNRYYNDNNCSSLEELSVFGYIDLLDPFLLFSIYSAITGMDIEIPTIKIGDLGYLPQARLVLAPYGAEIKIMNHFYYDDKYFQLNFNYGKNKNKTSYMIEFNADKIYEQDNYFMGSNIAIWRQPELLIDEDDSRIDGNNAQNKIGGKALAIMGMNISEDSAIRFDLGYKTQGYNAGDIVRKGWVVRAGLELRF